MTAYLRTGDVLRIVERFGFHVRDAGLLSSALARPAASMFGVEVYDTIDRKAAALLESLLRDHVMIDGNERTGWTAMVVFLWINGFRHDFDADGAFDLVLGVAEGAIDLDDAARTIAEHRVPR